MRSPQLTTAPGWRPCNLLHRYFGEGWLATGSAPNVMLKLCLCTRIVLGHGISSGRQTHHGAGKKSCVCNGLSSLWHEPPLRHLAVGWWLCGLQRLFAGAQDPDSAGRTTEQATESQESNGHMAAEQGLPKVGSGRREID